MNKKTDKKDTLKIVAIIIAVGALVCQVLQLPYVAICFLWIAFAIHSSILLHPAEPAPK